MEAAIRQGANVSARDGFGFTLLQTAAASSTDPEVIKLLVELGAEVNAQDECGWTPLHKVTRLSGSSEIVLTLLELGADRRARAAAGKTALGIRERTETLSSSPAYWRLNDLRF